MSWRTSKPAPTKRTPLTKPLSTARLGELGEPGHLAVRGTGSAVAGTGILRGFVKGVVDGVGATTGGVGGVPDAVREGFG